MNFDLKSRTILYVRHGSHAYGLNIESSDEDFKGVCVKPKSCYFGIASNFEQHEHMGSKNDGVDSVTFALDKFVRLAADCNPNIIEILFVDDSDVLDINSWGEELREFKDNFISRKAKHTFSGYAHAQLHRIKNHRAWLLNPPAGAPARSDFGLSDVSRVSKSELGAYDSAIESGIALDVPKSVLTLFTREKQYAAAKTHYDQYVHWKKSRNPARAELEAKVGYDSKHGAHLIRLMRMCKEILETGKVNVKRRFDREELLEIRNGHRPYDSLIEEAEKLESDCEELYKTSTVRKEPDREKIDAWLVDFTERYLAIHG
jgi:predicted nucleotidyltransferase